MKKQRCGGCPHCAIIHDPTRSHDGYTSSFFPRCLEFATWLDYDKRYSVNLTKRQAYRLEICKKYGRPE